ncbi:MAG: hypothetical protein E6K43_08190 [Gammaproteobacteria bacterium]|nr:MAG: hypothetical protein E6K43_08190 [Gammaproteobacteria bacterium]
MAPGMENNTPAATSPATRYQVDDLIIDLGQQRVTRAGNDIPLPHLSFELLVTLARAAPDLVTFDQLTERVWTGLVITPETISQRVKLVRDALGDDPHAPRYIAGVRGRGYRMVATVRPLADRRRSSPAEGPDAPIEAAGAAARPPVLGWLGGILAVALLLAAPWAISRYLRGPAPAELSPGAPGSVVVQPPRTIAVLPLIDMSPAGGNAYLGDGLAQELSARLARIRGLRVAARTSAFAFKDRRADVHTIAQTLGVRHILEGSVRREGDHLRVTAQLIDAGSGYNVWSQTYDRTWQDLLARVIERARATGGPASDHPFGCVRPVSRRAREAARTGRRHAARGGRRELPPGARSGSEVCAGVRRGVPALRHGLRPDTRCRARDPGRSSLRKGAEAR